MGVDREVKTAGDGELWWIALSLYLKKTSLLYVGKNFPKKGQTVTVHYTGKLLIVISYYGDSCTIAD